MSDLGPASSDAGGSSTSLCVRRPPAVGGPNDGHITALRQSVRGMEAQLIDLVLESASPERMAEWLRVPLACAAASGNLAAVKRLLAAGVKTETPHKLLRPAPLLHTAAAGGNERVVEELLKAGANVREMDSARHDRTALHCAASAGSDAAVRALTCAGADVDALDARGWTPLHCACTGGHRGVVVFLLLKGASVRETVSEEASPLHLAAAYNRPGVIEDLLSFGNIGSGLFNGKGLTALHVAVSRGRVEACLALLRGGAAVDRTTSRGFSCLDMAASNGHTGQLLQVLTAAESANLRERRCSMALYYAAKANRPNTIRDLVALGGNVNFRNPGKVPNLYYAAGRGARGATEALLQAGANIEESSDGRTPLHMACVGSHTSTVRLLLRWDADETSTDYNNKTAAMLVGAATASPDMELQPAEFITNQLVEDGIRNMLEKAPMDRVWRRRGWLVLCRARWLARLSEERVHPSTQLGVNPRDAKKRRGKIIGSTFAAKPRDFSLDEGISLCQTEGMVTRLPEATAVAAMLRLGSRDVFSGGSARQADGVARLTGRARFMAVVEQLLLLREDPIFREIVTFL